MYKHETIRNWLIGYLIFISVNWNLETTDRLAGYSIKVHSTTIGILNTECYLHAKGYKFILYMKWKLMK